MLPSAPVKLVDLFALASAGSVTVGTAWFVVRLAKAIVPSVVGYLSRRRLLRTIEKLAASPPPARIELTSQGSCSILACMTVPLASRGRSGCSSSRCAHHEPRLKGI
jgi:hypothetical protein